MLPFPAMERSKMSGSSDAIKLHLSPAAFGAIVAVASAVALFSIAICGCALVRRMLKRHRKHKEEALNRQRVRLQTPLYHTTPKIYASCAEVPMQVHSESKRHQHEHHEQHHSSPTQRRSSLPLNFNVAKALTIPYEKYPFSSSDCLTTEDEDAEFNSVVSLLLVVAIKQNKK